MIGTALLAILTSSTDAGKSNVVPEKVWERVLQNTVVPDTQGHAVIVLYDPATRRAAFNVDGKVFRLHATTGAAVRVFDGGLKPTYDGRINVFGTQGFSKDFMFAHGKFSITQSLPDELLSGRKPASKKVYVEVKGKREEHTVLIETDSQFFTSNPHAGFYLVNRLTGKTVTRLPLASQYYWSVIGNPSSGAYFFYGRAIFPEQILGGFSTYVFHGDSEVTKFRDAHVYDIDETRFLGAHAGVVDGFPTYPLHFAMYALPSGKPLWNTQQYNFGILFGDYVLANPGHTEQIDVLDAKTGKVLARSAFPPGRLKYTDYTRCFVSDGIFVQVETTSATDRNPRKVTITGWKLRRN